MFTECRQYLIDKLKAAGIRSPFTSEKALSKCQDSHLGAVLMDTDTFLQNGSKTYFKDETGAAGKRRKVFDRTLTFSVVIGEFSAEKAEAILTRFVALLGGGLYVEGNYFLLTVEAANWEDGEDTILKAKFVIEVKVSFQGGVYRDTGFAKLRELEVASITKEDSING